VKLEKAIKKLGTGVREELDKLSERGLRDAIVEAETMMREIASEMEQDDRLAGAKEIVKDLAGGYREARQAQEAKVQYSLHRLEEMGKL
jgi:hypothetical protein